MDESARAALATDRTIDITTTGRRSAEPRRIEVWMWRYDGHTYLSGAPGRRDWLANLTANPDFTLHLKQSARVDLPAHARPITDEQERRKVIAGILDEAGRTPDDPEEWVARSPLAEVEFR